MQTLNVCRYNLRRTSARRMSAAQFLRSNNPESTNNSTPQQSPEPTPDTPQAEYDNSALVERFTQILESKLTEPTLTKSLVDEDKNLKQLHEKYTTDEAANKQFQSLYQRQLATMKSENLLKGNKHARDLADPITNKPWDGNESVMDASMRMLLDSKPPPKKFHSNKIITPPLSIKDRLANAKESSLDYKVNKKLSKEDDDWREMYKERLLGPSMLINHSNPHTTIGFINTIANTAINASINQNTGKFESEDMHSVRGKPLSKEHLANCTDSNYFINQILNKQEILPPWVETHQSIDRELSSFRNDMDKKWQAVILDKLRSEFNDNKVGIFQKISSLSSTDDAYYDSNFHNKHLPYVVAKTNLINKSIRDYNLQCPSSSSHKFKLLAETELKKLYERAIDGLHTYINNWFKREEQGSTSKRTVPVFESSGGSLFGLFDSGGGASGGSAEGDYRHRQRPVENIPLWKSIKEMFKN